MIKKLTNPYINTILTTSLMLYPHQMNNEIYTNLKDNLEEKLKNKCYKNFGFIKEIIQIIEYKDGIIEAENTDSSANFNIKFSCQICAPLRNTQIICKIERVNKLLITAINGPILIIITNDRINDKKFFKDVNNNIRARELPKDKNIIQPNDFIIVTIKTTHFFDKDEKIKAIGIMEDIANEEDKKFFYENIYSKKEIIDFDVYKSGEIDN